MKQRLAVEALPVGPMLRESVAVAIRHWPIVLLAVVGITIWSLVILFVVGRSVASAGFSDEGSDTLARLGVWFGIRFVTWFILGYVVYRILTVEAGIRSAVQNGHDPRLRLLLAGVLCFASVSLIPLMARIGLIFGLDGLGLYNPDHNDDPFALSELMEAVISISVESYIAARFAVFAASLLQRPEHATFALNWAAAAGTRLKLFLALFVIDLAIVVIYLGITGGLLRIVDLDPAADWLSAFALLSHAMALDQVTGQLLAYWLNAIEAALYAGVFIALHRWQVGREMRAFD